MTRRNVDFITLNGQPVRVTSLEVSPEGQWSLVVIARGTASRDHLTDLLREPHVTIGVGEEPPRPLAVGEVNVRSSGEGQQAIFRFAITMHDRALVPNEQAPSTMPTPEHAEDIADTNTDERLARIEAKLDELLRLLRPPRD